MELEIEGSDVEIKKLLTATGASEINEKGTENE